MNLLIQIEPILIAFIIVICCFYCAFMDSNTNNLISEKAMERPKRLIWLDDVRDPLKNNWLKYSPIQGKYNIVWLKSYDQFIEWIIKNGLPTAICFDHDLGWTKTKDNQDEEKTGMDCAKWLVEYCLDNDLKLPLYNIQSDNIPGKMNIDGLLSNFKKHSKA